MGLPELLERVRAATGPDRELDVRLQAHFDGRVVRESEGMLLAKSTKPPYDECLIGRVDPGVRSRNFTIAGSCPAFTASIDAAVALVERMLPNWGWTDCRRQPTFRPGDLPRYALKLTGLRASDDVIGEHLTSLPLAICAALLSALIAREEAAAGEARCPRPERP